MNHRKRHQTAWLLLFFSPVPLIQGCTEALPNQNPQSVGWTAAERSEGAALETKRLLLQCQREREQTAALIKEASTILEQIREARDECQRAMAEALRPRPPKIIRLRPACPVEKPKKAPEPEEAPPSPAPPPAWPEYSPSDAPQHHGAQKGGEEHGEKGHGEGHGEKGHENQNHGKPNHGNQNTLGHSADKGTSAGAAHDGHHGDSHPAPLD